MEIVKDSMTSNLRMVLIKLQLMAELEMKFDVEKNIFISRLKKLVISESDFTNFRNIFNENSKYFGYVNYDGFKFKNQRNFEIQNLGSLHISGKFSVNETHLIIYAEINGFTNTLIFAFIIILLLYIFIICLLFSSHLVNSSELIMPFLKYGSATTFLFLTGLYILRRVQIVRMIKILRKDFISCSLTSVSVK